MARTLAPMAGQPREHRLDGLPLRAFVSPRRQEVARRVEVLRVEFRQRLIDLPGDGRIASTPGHAGENERDVAARRDAQPLRRSVDLAHGLRRHRDRELRNAHGIPPGEYPRETVVAEKVEAMAHLGIANSRMKDFFDVWFLARTSRSRGACSRRPSGQHSADEAPRSQRCRLSRSQRSSSRMPAKRPNGRRSSLERGWPATFCLGRPLKSSRVSLGPPRCGPRSKHLLRALDATGTVADRLTGPHGQGLRTRSQTFGALRLPFSSPSVARVDDGFRIGIRGNLHTCVTFQGPRARFLRVFCGFAGPPEP